MYQIGLTGRYLGLRWISRKSVKVTFLPYHVTWAKNSYFQNLLRITQYGSRLFGIDASSDPAKFQGDWPSRSPLIGAWSMTWHQLDKIVKNWHQPVKWTFFGPNSTSDVPDRFNRSISRSQVNFKKIGEGHIFAISRDLVTWAKNSYFQNLLRITQYGSRLFGIDASSDPAKFQGDWPSGSPLIGAWSMTWHQLDKIVKNWHQPVKWIFSAQTRLLMYQIGLIGRYPGLR